MTIGLKFWKSPRRKVFAVPVKDLKGKSRSTSKKRHNMTIDTDSDSDEPTPKRLKDDTVMRVERIESNVEDLLQEVDSMKTSINDILHLNERSKVPVALQRLMRDAFQCKICLCTPTRPPVIMSKCCKSILGCERCINEWFNGPDALLKACPACKTERGYSETLMLRGLDSFLTEVKSVIQTEDERDEEQLPAIN